MKYKNLTIAAMMLTAVSLFSNCSKTELAEKIPLPNHNNLAAAADGVYDLLGYGYDVTEECLVPGSASTSAIINVTAFAQAYPTKVYAGGTGSGTPKMYSGANVYDYLRSLNEERKYNGSVQFGTAVAPTPDKTHYTGSVTIKNSNMDKYTFSSKYSWATFESIRVVKWLKFTDDVTLSMLMNYLTPDFTSNINTYSAEQLVQIYGTHVLLDFTLGGRLIFDFSASMANQTTDQTKVRSVQAGLGAYIKKFGFNLSTDITATEMTHSFNESAERKLYLQFYGGTNSGLSVPIDKDGNTAYNINIASWEQSVTATNSALVKIDRMVPLDIFITDPVKKAQVATAIQNYIASRQINVVTDPAEGTIPFYHHHKYSDGTGHYLSANKSESGYIYDRPAFRAFTTQKPGTQPVFEFWGQKNGKVYHFYQFGVNQTSFWHITGVKFYAYPSQVQGTIPIYGYSNPWGEDHYFTDENLSGSYWVTKWNSFSTFPYIL